MAACTAFASSDSDAGALSCTASVRMGISRGSCGSSGMGKSNFRCLVQLMRFERYLKVAVDLESLSAEAAAILVGVDDLDDARVQFPIRGQAGGPVHQQ